MSCKDLRYALFVSTKKTAKRRDAGRSRGSSIEEEILRRTIEELAEQGLGALKIGRIAKAAEVNKTSVYRRWATRDALVAAALERVLEDLELSAVDTGSTVGDLSLLAMSIAGFLATPPGRALAQAAFANAVSPHLATIAKRRLEGP